MFLWSWKTGLVSLVVLSATSYAVAQMSGQAGMQDGASQSMMPPQNEMHAQMHARMMQMMQGSGMHGNAGQHGMMGMHDGLTQQPTLPGQDAFGAIQEIVQILQSDPTTDWSKVNITVLRQHLIDMNEVTLHAFAAERNLDNGIEIAVAGEGRTLDAIRRMVPAHISELVKLGWNAKIEDLPNGVKLTVITNDPKEAIKLHALGFMGIMVQGGHHQPHHLMMAKGEMPLH
jgi:hypothetical protein